ncbi:MAG: transglutaminase-like cysteine peptidase [Sulfuritalea sp.]|nr:transglutaminase-like cysteine peptidase [Sulfuritalea sp.]
MIQNKATLEAVNHEVNENSRYVEDITQYKVEDRWEDITETNAGDCEDYAIAKIRKLLALGWPKADLRLAMVGIDNASQVDHGVACARDSAGQWWVLDNRHPYVMAPGDLGHRWFEWGIGTEWTTVNLT